MVNPLKQVDLRAQGAYSDTYSDTYHGDFIGIFHAKSGGQIAKPSREPSWQIVSSYFQFRNDIPQEQAAIWAAITTEWLNRATYADRPTLKAAIDAALTTAGYTLL
jgi:hypothetical protein